MKLLTSLAAFAAKHKLATIAFLAVPVAGLGLATAIVAYDRRQERLARAAEAGVSPEELERAEAMEHAWH